MLIAVNYTLFFAMKCSIVAPSKTACLEKIPADVQTGGDFVSAVAVAVAGAVAVAEAGAVAVAEAEAEAEAGHDDQPALSRFLRATRVQGMTSIACVSSIESMVSLRRERLASTPRSETS